MSLATGPTRPAPRICLCVLMTHPFPKNLPLLRRIYADRFSAVRFILPFERSADADVITVYRGSYVHAAYLTDARAELERLDCDYYMVVQDDVLLNPKISEAEFFDFFDLGEDEGFIPQVGPVADTMGGWIWYYGFLAKLLFPKSILFGSGVELRNLLGYLPPAAELAAAFARSGIEASDSVRLDVDDMAPIAAEASRLLLHGLAAQLANTPRQQEIEAASLRIERDLIATMLAAQIGSGEGGEAAGNRVALPLPVVSAGYFTDFYILPRSGLGDFCHYMGVLGAANLFVEISAPTALAASCRRVRRAADFGLDCDGFNLPKAPDWLRDQRALAIHPFKLSGYDSDERRDVFVATLTAIRADRSVRSEPVVRRAADMLLTAITRDGWSAAERWGTWAGARDAAIEIPLAGPAGLRLDLRAPLDAHAPTMTGRLSFHGGRDVVPFSAAWPATDFTVEVAELRPDPDGVARLTLTSDRLVVPAERNPGSADDRTLGFGLLGAAWGETIARGYVS